MLSINGHILFFVLLLSSSLTLGNSLGFLQDSMYWWSILLCIDTNNIFSVLLHDLKHIFDHGFFATQLENSVTSLMIFIMNSQEETWTCHSINQKPITVSKSIHTSLTLNGTQRRSLVRGIEKASSNIISKVTKHSSNANDTRLMKKSNLL